VILTHSSASEAPRTARKPNLLLWLVVLAIVAALGWTGVWVFAAQQTVHVLQAWMEREKSLGRLWSCPHPHIGGYPTGIAISCDSARFDGLIFGHTYSGTLQSFRATADLSHPRDIDLDVGSPFVATSKDDKVNFHLAWRDLGVRLNGSPEGLWQASVAGQNLALTGGAGAVAFHGMANDAAVVAGQRADADGTLDFDVALRGASLPLIDQFLGPGQPSDIAAKGSVTKTNVDPGLTPAQNLARWQAAGGHVDLASVALTRGSTKFEAHGSFAINAAHHIEGHFDTKSSGLEPVLQHYGIDPSLMSMGAFLSNLLSGHSSAPSSQQTAELRLPVDIDDGRLAVGPIHTSVQLPPVY
jgi:hypothetical protein